MPPTNVDYLEPDLSYKPERKGTHASRKSFKEGISTLNEIRGSSVESRSSDKANQGNYKNSAFSRNLSNNSNISKSRSQSLDRKQKPRQYFARDRVTSKDKSSQDRSTSISNRQFRNNNISSNRDMRYNSNEPSSTNRKDLVCFKCNAKNHFARNCPSKVVKCYSCGNLGYTIRTCPKCSKNPKRH